MKPSSKQTISSSLALDEGTVQSVVEHMNTDHADACLIIVRAFSEQSNAVHAQLIHMDSEGVMFQVKTHSGGESTDDQCIRIDFSKPLRVETQIRGALVALTRQAREKLAN